MTAESYVREGTPDAEPAGHTELGGDAELVRALDQRIRPFLQSHGGDVQLLSWTDGQVKVKFVAACSACDLRTVTFAATVRARLLEVPGVESVVCDSVAVGPAHLDRIARFFD